MSKTVKNTLICVGLIVLLLAILAEPLFSIETGLTGFFIGVAVGLLIGGIVTLISKKKEKQSENQTNKPIN